jgi:hypothetical protein
VRPPAWERAPHRRDGPTKTRAPPTTREGCRHPVDQGAFHRCSDEHVRGLLLLVSRAGLPLTPPTRCPHGWGQSAFWTLQASLSGQARHRLRESRSPFLPVGNAAPGTDDPSAPTWLGLRGLWRRLIALAVPTPTAVPLAFDPRRPALAASLAGLLRAILARAPGSPPTG